MSPVPRVRFMNSPWKPMSPRDRSRFLSALDEDFHELFKVKVDFDDSLPRTPEFEMLYARFGRPVYTMGLRLLGSREAAEEARARRGKLRIFFGEHMRPGAVRKLVEAKRDYQRAGLGHRLVGAVVEAQRVQGAGPLTAGADGPDQGGAACGHARKSC